MPALNRRTAVVAAVAGLGVAGSAVLARVPGRGDAAAEQEQRETRGEKPDARVSSHEETSWIGPAMNMPAEPPRPEDSRCAGAPPGAYFFFPKRASKAERAWSGVSVALRPVRSSVTAGS